MTAQPHAALNEPSLADAIVHIEQSEALSPEQALALDLFDALRRRGRSTDPRPSFPPAGWRSVPGWKNCILPNSA